MTSEPGKSKRAVELANHAAADIIRNGYAPVHEHNQIAEIILSTLMKQRDTWKEASDEVDDTSPYSSRESDYLG